jgi:hypothetical protein
MRMPWHRRAEAAEDGALDAEREYEESKQRWKLAHELAAESRYQRDMNGWTAKVLSIFGDDI